MTLAAPNNAKALTKTLPLTELKAFRSYIDERICALKPETDSVIASKVFAIPELLETVLLALDYTEIFAVMRVDRTFNNTIAASTKLRRKIFKAHGNALDFDDTRDVASSEESISIPVCNMLIEPALEGLGFVQMDARYLSEPGEQGETGLFELAYTNNEVVINEWLGKALSWHFEPQRLFVGSEIGKLGSWAATYLTAYPMRVKVWFTLGEDYFEDDEEEVCYYLEAEGATMGRLYDVGLKARQALQEKGALAAV